MGYSHIKRFVEQLVMLIIWFLCIFVFNLPLQVQITRIAAHTHTTEARRMQPKKRLTWLWCRTSFWMSFLRSFFDSFWIARLFFIIIPLSVILHSVFCVSFAFSLSNSIVYSSLIRPILEQNASTFCIQLSWWAFAVQTIRHFSGFAPVTYANYIQFMCVYK